MTTEVKVGDTFTYQPSETNGQEWEQVDSEEEMDPWEEAHKRAPDAVLAGKDRTVGFIYEASGEEMCIPCWPNNVFVVVAVGETIEAVGYSDERALRLQKGKVPV